MGSACECGSEISFCLMAGVDLPHGPSERAFAAAASRQRCAAKLRLDYPPNYKDVD